MFLRKNEYLGVELRDGDKVEYVEEDGRKGKVAAQVQVID